MLLSNAALCCTFRLPSTEDTRKVDSLWRFNHEKALWETSNFQTIGVWAFSAGYQQYTTELTIHPNLLTHPGISAEKSTHLVRQTLQMMNWVVEDNA